MADHDLAGTVAVPREEGSPVRDVTSGWVARQTNPTEVLRVGSELATVLATTQETNGDLFAVELQMPQAADHPSCRHAPSEIYRVPSGEFTFYVTGSDGTTTRRVASAS